jgi:hypothetical protein
MNFAVRIQSATTVTNVLGRLVAVLPVAGRPSIVATIYSATVIWNVKKDIVVTVTLVKYVKVVSVLGTSRQEQRCDLHGDNIHGFLQQFGLPFLRDQLHHNIAILEGEPCCCDNGVNCGMRVRFVGSSSAAAAAAVAALLPWV